MATLSPALSSRRQETFTTRPTGIVPPTLRAWLRGNWALLFSHADDFACSDLESDRWLVVMRQTFAAAGVRPLALTASMSPRHASWVREVGGSSISIAPEEFPEGPDTFDLQIRTLRDAVAQASSRFVMFIDESLRLRRTFSYTAQDHLPSPLDLAATVGKLRAEAHQDSPPRTPPGTWPGIRPGTSNARTTASCVGG